LDERKRGRRSAREVLRYIISLLTKSVAKSLEPMGKAGGFWKKWYNSSLRGREKDSPRKKEGKSADDTSLASGD